MLSSNKTTRSIVLASVCALLFVVVYMGAYYAMLIDKRFAQKHSQHWPPALHWFEKFTIEPVYREQGDITYAIFWPAHQIDRRIRPSHWPII